MSCLNPLRTTCRTKLRRQKNRSLIKTEEVPDGSEGQSDQEYACLVVNPITVGNFAFLFNCTPVGRTSDSMMVPT